jgi:PadR family transcriptional regulator PadR
MPKSDSVQGSLDLLVLQILSRRPGLHGYSVMSESNVSAINGTCGEVLTARGNQQLTSEEPRWQAVTSAANRVLRMV